MLSKDEAIAALKIFAAKAEEEPNDPETPEACRLMIADLESGTAVEEVLERICQSWETLLDCYAYGAVQDLRAIEAVLRGERTPEAYLG